MSRKHYVEVAAVLKSERGFGTSSATSATLDRITRDLADAFKRDNPRFDSSRFYVAAGMDSARFYV